MHDLKNPLSAIQMGLELLDTGDQYDPAAPTQLRRLRDTAHAMGRMIQNILDIGRAEQVGLELHRTRIRLDTWIPRSLQDVESRARHLNHELSWLCPPGLEIEADPEFLRRLLLNLLDNALKYSPSGSRTELEVRLDGDTVHLEVRDQGQGIPEHLRGSVFGKFVRLGDGGSIPGSGSGLGLAFCRMVAEAHQGRIWVEANRPRGSVFVLEFPRVGAACPEG